MATTTTLSTRAGVTILASLTSDKGVGAQADRVNAADFNTVTDRTDGVSYHERIPVPAATTVTRTLSNASLEDALGEPLSMARVWAWRVENTGNVPLLVRAQPKDTDPLGVSVGTGTDYLLLNPGSSVGGVYKADENAPATTPFEFKNPSGEGAAEATFVVTGQRAT